MTPDSPRSWHWAAEPLRTPLMLLLSATLSSAAAAVPVTWDGDCGNMEWLNRCGAELTETNWNAGVPKNGEDVLIEGARVDLSLDRQTLPDDTTIVVPTRVGTLVVAPSASLRVLGILVIEDSAEANNLTMSGSVEAQGLLTTPGDALWQRSAFSGGAGLLNTGNLRIQGEENEATNTAIRNQGSVIQETTLDLSNTTVTNESTWSMDLGAALVGSNSSLVNRGTLQSTGSEATAKRIAVPFHNQGGTVRVSGNADNELRIEGGGSSTGGQFQLGDRAAVRFRTAPFELQGAVEFSGLGEAIVVDGELNAAEGAQVTFDLAASGLTLQSSGVLGGPGSFVNAGSADWSGGTIDAGDFLNTGLLRVLPSPLEDPTVARLLRNEGSIELLGNAALDLEAPLENLATGSIELDLGDIRNPGQVFPLRNRGTLLKTGGDGTGLVSVPIENHGGTIRVDRGRLRLQGGGTHEGGSYDVSPGATLELFGNQTTVTANVSATGEGIVRLQNESYLVDAGAEASFDLRENGRLEIVGSTAGGAGKIVNLGNARISGARLTGSTDAGGARLGLFQNAESGDLSFLFGGPPNRIDVIFDNRGTVHYVNGNVVMEDEGALLNNGSFRFEGQGAISSTGGRIINGGDFVKTEPPATGVEGRATITAPFDQVPGGRLVVETDELRIEGGGEHRGGSYQVEQAGLLNFFRGTTVASGDVRASGEGRLQIASGASYEVADGGVATFSLNPNGVLLEGTLGARNGGQIINSSTLTQTGGTVGLPGGGEFRNLDLHDWLGGSVDGLYRNEGRLILHPDPTGDFTLKGTLLNQSLVEQQDPLGGIRVLQGAQFINEPGGRFVLRSNVFGDGTLVNQGLIEVPSSSLTSVRVDATDGSVLRVAPSTEMGISGGGTHSGSGSYELGSLSELMISGRQLSTESYQIVGEGTFFVEGSLAITGELTNDLTGDGALILDRRHSPDPLPLLSLESASSRLTNRGVANWGNGTIAGPGVLRNEGALFVDESGDHPLSDFATLDNAGGSVVQSGRIQLESGANVRNSGDYVLDGEESHVFVPLADPDSVRFVQEAGALRKMGPGQALVRAPLDHDGGTVEVDSGELVLHEVSGAASGDYRVAENAMLELERATYSGTYRATGEGILRAASERFEVQGGRFVADLSSPGGFEIDGDVRVGGGTSGGGELVNEGSARWLSGVVSGSGVLRNEGLLRIADPLSAVVLDAQLENAVGAEIVHDGSLRMRSGNPFPDTAATARLVNRGTYRLNGTLEGIIDPDTDQEEFLDALPQVENEGAFIVGADLGSRTLNMPFDNTGTFEVGENTQVDLTGFVPQLKQTAAAADRRLEGGTWVVNDGASLDVGDIDLFSNAASIVLRGTGRLNNLPDVEDIPPVGFSNEGTIRLENAAALVFDGQFENEAGGVVSIETGSTLVVEGQFETNEGSTVEIDGNVVAGSIDNDGGAWGGLGRINSLRFSNGGTLLPGRSPGVLTIGGDFEQLAGGTLEIELGGTTPGLEYDQLVIEGASVLDGLIEVTLLAPLEDEVQLQLEQGDSFDIVIAETVELLPGLAFDLPALPGRLALEPSVAGLGDGRDVLRLRFVPEPSPLVLIGLGLSLLASLRSSRHRRPD